MFVFWNVSFWKWLLGFQIALFLVMLCSEIFFIWMLWNLQASVITSILFEVNWLFYSCCVWVMSTQNKNNCFAKKMNLSYFQSHLCKNCPNRRIWKSNHDCCLTSKQHSIKAIMQPNKLYVLQYNRTNDHTPAVSFYKPVYLIHGEWLSSVFRGKTQVRWTS